MWGGRGDDDLPAGGGTAQVHGHGASQEARFCSRVQGNRQNVPRSRQDYAGVRQPELAYHGGALYVFSPEEARRLARKIEIKYTPKHGSWLNIAELEFAVLGRTVFKKRIGDKKRLQRELDAICGQRNVEGIPVRWQFNLGKAREKMAWAYPETVKESD
ncbi:MAG: hypothetical protein ACOH2K_17900 [Burkholderiaceae bacterium]